MTRRWLHRPPGSNWGDFGDDDEDGEDDDEGFVSGLLPGHRGSMWTLGATIYF